MFMAVPSAAAAAPAPAAVVAASSPSAPTDVTAVADPGAVQLTWKAPLVTQATIITYLVTTDDLSTGAVSAPTASADGAEPEDTVGGLTAGDRYDFTVQARTTDGEGDASAPSNTVVAQSAAGTVTSTSPAPTSPAPAPTTTTTTSPSPQPARSPPASARHRRPHRARHVAGTRDLPKDR
jgi:hypothetical protein